MFDLDLKRLYYGATAFLVFLVAFLSLQTLTDNVLRLIVVSNVSFEERRPGPVPILPPPPTAAPVAGTHQPTPVPEATLTPEQRALLEEKERVQLEDWELRTAKEGVASSLAIVLVALPVWFWHWRRWRALTQTESVQFFRLYVYALMLVALVTTVFRGASAVSKIVTWFLGAADLSTRFATLTFAQEFIGSVIGALIALLAWWYHWTSVRGEREVR